MIEYRVKVDNCGNKYWYLNDERHREDGPAIEWANGNKEWFLNGKLHRENGPACEYADGSKYWFLNGKRHRGDGPAVEWVHGTKEWYLNGIKLSEQEFLRKTSPELQVIEDLRKVAERYGYKLIKT